MVGVAQLVEHKVVALVAAGSSPVAHPNFHRDGRYGRLSHFLEHEQAPVAQLDRASDFESGCRRFEPCRARQLSNSSKLMAHSTKPTNHELSAMN